jgi:uncharacterized protein YndB with AHSA1/START domain
MNKTTVHLRVSRKFDAPPIKVFNAWLIPQEASKFLFATPTGQITRCEIDPRVGGKFVIIDKRDGVDAFHTGQYVEVTKPKRLTFTFSTDEHMKNPTRVFIEILLMSKGCELILTHEGVPEDYATRTTEGWTKMLDALDAVLKAA